MKLKRSKTYGKKTRYKSPCDKGGKLQRLALKKCSMMGSMKPSSTEIKAKYRQDLVTINVVHKPNRKERNHLFPGGFLNYAVIKWIYLTLSEPQSYDTIIYHTPFFFFLIKKKTSQALLLLLLLSHVSHVRLCVTPQTAAHQAPVPGILQASILEWVAISFSSA